MGSPPPPPNLTSRVAPAPLDSSLPAWALRSQEGVLDIAFNQSPAFSPSHELLSDLPRPPYCRRTTSELDRPRRQLRGRTGAWGPPAPPGQEVPAGERFGPLTTSCGCTSAFRRTLLEAAQKSPPRVGLLRLRDEALTGARRVLYSVRSEHCALPSRGRSGFQRRRGALGAGRPSTKPAASTLGSCYQEEPRRAKETMARWQAFLRLWKLSDLEMPILALPCRPVLDCSRRAGGRGVGAPPSCHSSPNGVGAQQRMVPGFSGPEAERDGAGAEPPRRWNPPRRASTWRAVGCSRSDGNDERMDAAV